MKNWKKRFGFAAFAAAIVFSVAALVGCADGSTPSVEGKNPVKISIAAIEGVTVPVTGETPVTEITETAQYTGTITWLPEISGVFAAETEYTATITLTAKPTFTLRGVAAGFFTVEEATATNAANSGVITAVFPPTGGETAKDQVTIDVAAIMSGVSVPATGEIPVTAIAETAQYTGTITWLPEISGVFAAETTYTAIITLTAQTGYTLQNPTVTVEGVEGVESVNYDESTGKITAVFPATGSAVIYGITLSPTGTYALTAATVGYAAQTPLTVTVTNSGNQPTGALTAVLSGTGADSFTLSKTSITSIAVSDSDTFTVEPKTGLAAGTHTATVTVSDGNSITADFSVSFTVNNPAPTYGITLSETGTHVFTAVTVGYAAAPTAFLVTVTNSGNQATGNLAAALSGTDTDSFTLSKTSITSLTVSGSDTFTVQPKIDLAEGTHTATVTVSGGNGITADFTVSFTVNGLAPSYGITLSETGTHTFTAAAYGYAVQTPLTVTVTNTGNRMTGALTAALSETGVDNFTLSTTSITSIAVGETGTFTVRPNTSLSVGTHTATVTVSGGSVTSKTFNVSFTVNKATPSINPWPSAASITYGAALSTSILSGGSSSTAGTFAWTNGAAIPTVANSGYGVTFTPTDTGNYNTATGTVSITVSKANPTVTTWPTAATIIYGAALSTSILSGGSSTPAGTFAWTNGTTVPPVGANSYSVTFTPADTSNYNTATGSVSITVNVPPVHSISLFRGERSVTIDMYDSGGDGWNGSGALRINVNGVNINTNVKVQTTAANTPANQRYTNTYTFNVADGDTVQVYWYTGTYQNENSFIVYYTDTPPNPAFTASNQGPTSWSGTGSLLHRVRTTTTSGTVSGTLQGTTNNALLGSFTGETQSTTLTGTHTFTTEIAGYTTAPTALPIIVSNTGNQATGNLTAALSGANTGSFTLTGASIANIAVGGTGAFTVRPNTGLSAGTHTATVTVSGGNGITASFNVSFTVIPPYSYIITGGGASFTATRGGSTVGTANDTIQNVINAIRTDANYNAATIQFGNGTNTLDIGTATVNFNTDGGSWNLVTLTGKITGAPSGGTISTSYVSVISTADIANTNENTSARAVYLSSAMTFTISGGTVSATTGTTVYNSSSGTVNISGGTVSTTTGTAVYNSSGTVNISGGTVSATTGRAVYNGSGTVNISGGTVSATTGIAVYDYYDSKGITVSRPAQVTSANVTTTEGTIYLAGHPLHDLAPTGTRLTINGGTVSNTAVVGGRAIYNDSTNQIYISGGTVQATGADGYAIMNISVRAMLSLNALYSNPTITGLIRPSAAGQLTVGTSLDSGSGPYVLDCTSYDGSNNIAVVNGRNYLSCFTLYNQPNLQLEVNGNNLVISVMPYSNAYVITGSGTSFTATRNGSTVGTANQAINTVINSVRTHANGAAATIQFVNGISTLNIGTTSAQFNNTGGTWGAVTLAGKITSSVSSASSGTIYIAGTVSVTSTADITNTNETNTTNAVYFDSTATLTISGGTVSSPNGVAVRNVSYGTVNISGGTVSTAGANTAAVRNTSYGTVNITGGMVLETGHGQQEPSTAMHNSGQGAVNISGGTVSSIYGTAVANSNTTGVLGTVNISGGIVSSTNARAVVSSNSGKITVSGTALVTSANSTSSSTGYSFPGTISILGNGLEITGGTVENTAPYASGRTIYFRSSSGTATISGGTVSATSGIAVYNDSTNGKIIVSGTALITSGNTSYNAGTIYLASAEDPTTVQLEVNGGNIRNVAWTGDNAHGFAIYNDDKGAITVTGGVVQSKMGRAIRGTDMDTGDSVLSSILNFTGGVLFCYYSSAAPNPAIGVTINADNGYRIYGIWENRTSTTYTAGTNTDIIASPSATASGVWAKNGGRSGINFTRNGITTFVEVDDVTVN